MLILIQRLESYCRVIKYELCTVLGVNLVLLMDREIHLILLTGSVPLSVSSVKICHQNSLPSLFAPMSMQTYC